MYKVFIAPDDIISIYTLDNDGLYKFLTDNTVIMNNAYNVNDVVNYSIDKLIQFDVTFAYLRKIDSYAIIIDSLNPTQPKDNLMWDRLNSSNKAQIRLLYNATKRYINITNILSESIS